MSRIFVSGLGAVSPAGWSVADLRVALQKETSLPTQPLARPEWPKARPARPVPPPASRPAFLAHPRLRRASPLTHYAASAALEALSPLSAHPDPNRRLGLIVCLQSGCVQYSCRFWEETLKDPTTASPLVFPETVFAALASHLATMVGQTPLACTLVGDAACFLQGVSLAADWLNEKRVEVCLVLGAEEHHWMVADALWYFQRSTVLSSGAGALCLSHDPALSLGVELQAITDAHTFTTAFGRGPAARAMRAQLPAGTPEELLCDGLDGSARSNKPERVAWQGWPGRRVSPKRILGEGLMAAAAWQCVAACDALASGNTPAATVSLVGANQQAIGARFVRSGR